MKITCDRKLGSVETEALISEAKLMIRLGLTQTWVGDGMLYRCTGDTPVFHFIDQK